MIKLQAEINGEDYELRLQRNGGLVSAAVGGRAYEVEIHSPSANELILRHGSQVYHCRVQTKSKQHDAFDVELRGNNFKVQLVDPKRLRGQQSAGAQDHGAVRIIASMPGKVVRLLVDVGAQVEAGAGIVVVEAMKMQNEMKSPKAGVVTALNAEAGSTVNAGDVLAEIE
jgi:biotin carboxyl carrier protein